MNVLDILKEGATPLRKTIAERDIGGKALKNPSKERIFALANAIRHDHTFPKKALAALGPDPKPEALIAAWGNIIDQALSNNQMGDLSSDGKLDNWLINLYTGGHTDYEEITAESGRAMGLWVKLLTMNKRTPDQPDPANPHRTIPGHAILDASGKPIPVLKPEHRKLENFKSLSALRTAMSTQEYQDIFNQLKKKYEDDAAMKSALDSVNQVVLINDDRFFVAALLSYGSTYVFARRFGYFGDYCTGQPAPSGQSYFDTYSKRGIIIGIMDKHSNDKNSKWQMLAVDPQLYNAPQERRNNAHANDEVFAHLFPGLMSRIIQALEEKGPEINEAAKDITKERPGPDGGYVIANEVGHIRTHYPLSVASVDPDAPVEGDEQAQQAQAGQAGGQ